MTSFKSSGYQLMRIKHGILGMLVFVFMATSTVHADQFIGAKLTSLNVHEQSSREPLNIAINLGHELDTWIADLSLVAEFSRTVAHGKTPLNEDLDVDYNAVYLLWKTTRSMFVTLRAGFADNEIINGDRSQNKRGLRPAFPSWR